MNNIYNRLFYKKHADDSMNSAEIIVPLILKVFPAQSVIDVGCGTGGWLQTFQRMGVRNIQGWDVNSMGAQDYAVEKSKIHTGCDFSSPDFKINRRADICISLEVAEHLPPTVADNFVLNLIRCSQVIIFSAAYPGQTGVNHINEQPPWYWRNKFNRHGYLELDFLRPFLWKNEKVSWWYRQNITAYIHSEHIKKDHAALALFKEYGQRDGPHRLTLVNEWILNRQLDNSVVTDDEKRRSQSDLPDSESDVSASHEKMTIELANHLLRMPLSPNDNHLIAQTFSKYNHVEISNAFVTKSQSELIRPAAPPGENQFRAKAGNSQTFYDASSPGCKDQEKQAGDKSFPESIPSVEKGIHDPYLSVIIPTRNRAKLLGKALDSLMAQTYSPERFEVIVIDNGSSDNTADLCQQYECNFKHFKYVHEHRPGLHAGRHRGMQEARGDRLVYCDDDIYALPSWLEGVADGFSRPDVVIVGGKILPQLEGTAPDWYARLWNHCRWGRWLGWYSLLDFGESVLEIPARYIWGCNFSIRKDILLEVGGFHPDSFPKHLLKYRGDGETAVSDAIEKKGYKAIYHPRASVYHWLSRERLTPKYLYARAFAQGISDSYTAIRSGDKSCANKIFVPCDDDIKNMIQKGYCNGFNYHRQEARRDPWLLKWIKRRNYLAIGSHDNSMHANASRPAEQAVPT